jgi:hypothetical protein
LAHVEASTVINAPVGEVYARAASPHNGPIFIPNLNENRDITPETDGLGQTWRWRFNLFGVDITGTGRVVTFEPDRAYVLETEGDATSRWTYSFEPAAGGTRVRLAIDYDVAEGLLKGISGAVAQRMNQQSCEQAMANLKAWIEP